MVVEQLESMIGKRVRLSQLREIFDTHIILTDVRKLEDNDVEGVLSFVGKELNDESDRLFVSGANICPIYREKEYFDGDVSYDD